MFKKLLLVLGLLLVCSQVNAEPLKLGDFLNKIPDIKNGAYFSFVDNGFNYSAQVEIAKWKGFMLNAGTAGDKDRTDWKAIASISYNITKLQNWGVDLPILKYVEFEPYICFGAGKINVKEMAESETDWGLGVNILNIKW